MKEKIVILTLVLMTSREAFSTVRNIKLQEIEKTVIERSYELKAKQAESGAIAEKAEALGSTFLPKLTLDAYYRYVSEIPTLATAPGRQLQFGDNQNYSVGPTVNMVLYDFGARKGQQESLVSMASSKKWEWQTLTKNVLQQTRFHYVNLVLLAEKQILLKESIKVAQDQLRDVEIRNRMGAGTKVDLLSARKEVNELLTQYKDTQGLMSVEIGELQRLLDDINLENISSPVAEKAQINEFKGANIIALEDFDVVSERLSKFETQSLNPQNHPRIRALKEAALASEQSAESIRSGRWPKLGLYARASQDYPNGPILETVDQRVIAVSFSMPLFDGGEITHSSQEKKATADSLKFQATHEERNIQHLYVLSLEKIKNLREQSSIIQKKIDESREIADLMFRSYKEGRSTFLEVERANVKYREAKLGLAYNQYHIINHLIILAALNGDTHEVQ